MVLGALPRGRGRHPGRRRGGQAAGPRGHRAHAAGPRPARPRPVLARLLGLVEVGVGRRRLPRRRSDPRRASWPCCSPCSPSRCCGSGPVARPCRAGASAARRRRPRWSTSSSTLSPPPWPSPPPSSTPRASSSMRPDLPAAGIPQLLLTALAVWLGRRRAHRPARGARRRPPRARRRGAAQRPCPAHLHPGVAAPVSPSAQLVDKVSGALGLAVQPPGLLRPLRRGRLGHRRQPADLRAHAHRRLRRRVQLQRLELRLRLDVLRRLHRVLLHADAASNQCPPGSLLGGWWKVDGSGFCNGPRYYMDCNAPCGGCGCGGSGVCSGGCSGTGCGCALGDCNNRKAGCIGFRYGQCNQQVVLHRPDHLPGRHLHRAVGDRRHLHHDRPRTTPPPPSTTGPASTRWSAT